MTREDYLRRQGRQRSAQAALSTAALFALGSGLALLFGPALQSSRFVKDTLVELSIEASPAMPASAKPSPPKIEAVQTPARTAARPPLQPRESPAAAAAPAQPDPTPQSEPAPMAAAPAQEDAPSASALGPSTAQTNSSLPDTGGAAEAVMDVPSPLPSPPTIGAGEPGLGVGVGVGVGTGNVSARSGGEGAAKAADPAAALSARLGAFIEKNKIYPPAARRRGTKGVVYLSLSVNAKGELSSIKSARSSGSRLLDEAAINLLRSAFPLEQGPGRELNLVLAIRYDLKG